MSEGAPDEAASRGGGESGSDGSVAPGGGERGGYPVREGRVELVTNDGRELTEPRAFVRYEPRAFVVATDPTFPADATTRYPVRTVRHLRVNHPRR